MPSEPIARTVRVLLVDDDLDGLELLAQLIRKAGHDVRVASAAEEALRELELFQPQVAIIDIGLPDLDGYELARRIRELAPCRLFALSGYSAATAPRDNAVTSFDQHFVKPVVMATLLEAIKSLPE
jgi:DNA-binding response OmpR family regulator